MDINIQIKNKKATILQTGALYYVCGNSDYVAKFTFDSEWANEVTKTARFMYRINTGIYSSIDVVFTGTSCAFPIIVNADELLVGVFAGNLRTTTSAQIIVHQGITSQSGTPQPITPDAYAQLMAAVTTLSERLDEIITTPANEVSAQEIIDARNGASTLLSRLNEIVLLDWNLNDLVFNSSKGPILKTPDGTKQYRIGISNSGVVTSTLIT